MPDIKKKCSQLLQDTGCSPKVITHCKAVYSVAMEYATRSFLVNPELVAKGAMLHDIGRSSTHSIGHAQRGADILRNNGFSEDLARIVECHTGAGLTADECTLLGLEPRDCIPRTIEEKIVTHSDNLIAGSKRVTIEEELASAIHLPRKVRKRIYRLSTEVEWLTQ